MNLDALELVPLESLDPVKVRFALARALDDLRPGTALRISGRLVRFAWPPTGDHDHSLEGALRSAALVLGGNRPETSYTTSERIRRDLSEDNHLEWSYPSAVDDVYVFRRPASDCHRCGGRGYYRSYDRAFALTFDESPDTTLRIDVHECDHSRWRD